MEKVTVGGLGIWGAGWVPSNKAAAKKYPDAAANTNGNRIAQASCRIPAI
jgi:hypothetical protein